MSRKSSPEELSGHQNGDGPKWKIPPVEAKSDSCVIHIGRKFGDVPDPETGGTKRGIVDDGTPYQVHAGESVWLIPATDMAAYFAIGKLQDWDGESAEEREAVFDRAADEIANWLVSWNWTDLAGRPLPQPYQNPAVLKRLDAAEISWLIQAIRNGPPDEQKNGAGA